jgi:hypothetical protein
VTYTAKVCAAIALILLNMFFLYFIILRGADKGRSWQWSYVMGCIFQLLTDGLLYETLECYWVREFVVQALSCSQIILNVMFSRFIFSFLCWHSKTSNELSPRYKPKLKRCCQQAAKKLDSSSLIPRSTLTCRIAWQLLFQTCGSPT